MARLRLSDPGVKERIQDRLAAGVSKEALARELGVSKVTLYAWLETLQEELQRGVATRKVEYAERLTQRQFSLYDELARMATLLQSEVAQLGQAQRGLRTEQRSLAIFRGCQVLKGYLETMAELLGQLQPPEPANIHLTRVEQLLNVTISPEQVPDHLRGAVLEGEALSAGSREPAASTHRHHSNGHDHAGH
jgi:transposase-like protein